LSQKRRGKNGFIQVTTRLRIEAMTSSFLLLQNEGFLVQNCIRTSLAALRTWRTEDRCAFYGAFFGLTVGFERLLKILILLDHWYRSRKFLTDAELKVYCHDIEKLYAKVESLFGQYGVIRNDNLKPDEIDREILAFLSSFARRGRYYNLFTLSGSEGATNPLGEWEDILREIYEKDIPEEKQIPEPDENLILVDHVDGNGCIKLTRAGNTVQTQTEHNYDLQKMHIALPEMCWRLVKLLAPLKSLLISIHEQIREKDHGTDGELSVPYMDEFLEFVGEDKTSILESEDWPNF
jgi:hypothetical protein